MKFFCVSFFFLSMFQDIEPQSSISSRALSTATIAEKKLAEGSPQSRKEAILLLEKAVSSHSFKRLQNEIQISIYMLLKTAYENEKCFDKEEKLLRSLIASPSFSRDLFALNIELIHFLILQERYEEVEHLCKKLHPKNVYSLDSKEREELLNTYVLLDERYKNLYTTAETYIQEESYAKACAILERLYYLFQKHAFPRTDSKISQQVFEVRIRSSLAYAHVKNTNLDRAYMLLKDIREKILPPEFSEIKNEAVLLLIHVLERKSQLEEALRIALETLAQQNQDFLCSKRRPFVVHSVANIYLKQNNVENARKTLEELLEAYPTYERRDMVFYTLASLIENENKDKAKVLRKELILTYPKSIYAAESFLKLYSTEEYLLFIPSAINHLEEMILLYPQSLHTMVAHYFLSKKAKDKEVHLRKLCSIFEEHEKKSDFSSSEKYGTEQKPCPEFQKLYIYALLEKGREHDSNAVLQAQRYIEHALTNDKTLLPLYAEALYISASISDTKQEARNQLRKLISWHSQNSFSSKFLAQAYYDIVLGEIEMEEYEQALKDCVSSEKSAQGALLLEIQVAKSECLKHLHKLDEAMLVLSKVINEDIASQVRIKAMFLRAEIYELQGRHDLAIKQLASAAKKGGEWAKKAKEKLEVTYGCK